MTEEEVLKKEFNPAEHTKLAFKFVVKFLKKSPSFSHLRDELIASCMETMVKEHKKYDPSKGNISTFCWPYFLRATTECINRMSSSIKVPKDQPLAKCYSMDEFESVDALEAEMLNKSCKGSDTTIELDIRQMIDELPKDMGELLTIRYGLFGEPEHTQQEAAKRMKVSRDAVRTLEGKALFELRKTHFL